jgi:hypothetical protein
LIEDYTKGVMPISNIVEKLGMPALSMATASPYNSFANYLIDPMLEPIKRNSPSCIKPNEHISQY